MALLRLLCFPTLSSASLFPHSTTTPISLHTPPPCLLAIKFKPQVPYLYCYCSPQVAPQTQQDESGTNRRVLAQNAPWTYTANDLRPLFEKYGTVEDIEVAMYNKTRSRGLVFVTMGSHEEAKAVLESLEAYELEGRPLRLAWAKPKTKKPSSPQPPKPLPVHNLFVANLHFEARSKDLLEFFNTNGANVVSAEVIFNDNPRRSAGYGFVSFNTKEEADAALSSFDGKEFMGRAIRVAHSKRFLREATKKTIQSQELPSELISVAE